MAKIYIFSGDDIVSSRQAYLDKLSLLKKETSIEMVAAKDIDEICLENIFGASDLFGLARTLATEKFFTGQKSTDKEKLIGKILSFPKAQIISWETKELSKTEQQKLGKETQVNNFKLPNLLFKFLDSLSPTNKQTSLLSLQQLKQNVDPQFIFLMIARQIRLMILAVFDEADSLPVWQIGKLKSQAMSFGQEKLLIAYHSLLWIDLKQKTSQSPFSLEGELDLFLTSL